MANDLKTELSVDTLERGYLNMTDEQIVIDLNTEYRTKDRETIETWEVFEATVRSEYNSLNNVNKQLYQTILSMGSINIMGGNTRTSLASMFGSGTATRSNLMALQEQFISRAVDLGIRSPVRLNHVIAARS